MPDSHQSYRNNKSLLDDGVMISYPAREIRYLKYDDFDKWEQSTNRIIGHQYFAKFNSQCFEQYPHTIVTVTLLMSALVPLPCS